MAEMSLLITRLRTDKYAVKTYPEILTNLIDEAILKNEPTAGEKNVKFIRDYENIQNKTIDGDFSLIFKVLDMVIENAVKFSPKGAEVTISGGIIGGRMIAEIIDRGPGFSANALDNLFEMFSSGELMSHSEGAGLSLAAAKVIMEAHNFDINAANNESGGASVILTF
jgi:K+-sensing histidine kinase KdpD